MKLTLDPTQRLNLHALMGAQRGGSVDDLRFYWRLQDRIELSQEEKDLIRYRTQEIAGAQQVLWDREPASRMPPNEFEFSQEELSRVYRMILDWAKKYEQSQGREGGFLTSERRWLEPLLEQLEFNGNKGV